MSPQAGIPEVAACGCGLPSALSLHTMVSMPPPQLAATTTAATSPGLPAASRQRLRVVTTATVDHEVTGLVVLTADADQSSQCSAQLSRCLLEQYPRTVGGGIPYGTWFSVRRFLRSIRVGEGEGGPWPARVSL